MSGETSTGVAIDDFRAGMRRLAASVTVITTLAQDGARFGMTATAVCSVSGDPPMLLCCINRNSICHEIVSNSGNFAVNVLAASDQDIANRFATPMDHALRFEKGAWGTADTGAPVLESAVASFDCRLDRVLEAGSHGVFFGLVQAVRVRGPHVMPLLYAHGGYGSFAGERAAFTEMLWTPDWQVYD